MPSGFYLTPPQENKTKQSYYLQQYTMNLEIKHGMRGIWTLSDASFTINLQIGNK
jgi:hypothetical protein